MLVSEAEKKPEIIMRISNKLKSILRGISLKKD